MALNRRQFIRIGAAAGAATIGSGLATNWWELRAHEIHDPRTDGDKVVPTFCELCFWKCGVLAHVRDGRVSKVVGNPAHPLSKGKICPRGTGAPATLYDPDRLKKPLLRRSKRGEESFEEVSWDTALDRVAEGMEAIRRKHGPEAFALFTHGWGGSWFTRLMQAYGSPNVAAPSYAQCRGPRDVAFTLTYGQGVGSPETIDIENARCITLLGSHLGENMHNTQVQEFATALGRGAKLVVVDPRFSVAASKADHWLPIRPGTDLALLLAWMNVIIGEKRYDADYVAKHTVGFEELAKHVADKTPEWAFPITGIEPEAIRTTARLIASERPASLVHPGRHATWYGDDTQRLRAVAILAALLGSWGRRGGYILPSSIDVPKFPAPSVATKGVADRKEPSLYPLADETLASGVCDATIPGRAPYQLHGWMVYGTNLIQALPDRRNVEKAIQELDFLVTIDILPVEIAGWSDVVLPEATYLERTDDLWSPAYKEPFVAIRQAAVEPMYESKPGWWIAKQVATRLGLGTAFPFDDPFQVIRWRTDAAKIDFATLVTRGVVTAAAAPVAEEEGMELSFDTPSGKIELASSTLAAAGFAALPDYTPHEEPPAGMFRLLSGRSPVHTFGRTTNNRFLGDIDAENEVWINSVAARAAGVAEGDRVVLENQDGVRSTPVRAKVTERIRGDAVYLVHGFGHSAKGLTFAHGRGASDSDLVTRYNTDPIMGGTGMSVNFVRLVPAEA